MRDVIGSSKTGGRAAYIAAALAILTAAAATSYGLYDREKNTLTDSAGTPTPARAHSLLVLGVASRCRTEEELSRRLGPAPIRVRRGGVSFVGYLCRDGKGVVVRTDEGGSVVGRPEIAPVVREGG